MTTGEVKWTEFSGSNLASRVLWITSALVGSMSGGRCVTACFGLLVEDSSDAFLVVLACQLVGVLKLVESLWF